jgi:WD40 repeat protein
VLSQNLDVSDGRVTTSGDFMPHDVRWTYVGLIVATIILAAGVAALRFGCPRGGGLARPLKTLATGGYDVDGLSFSSDGRLLIALIGGKTVKGYDTRSDQEVLRIPGHGSLFALALSPDGKTLAVGGREVDVKLWDLTTSKEKASLATGMQDVKSLAFSPDGRLLAAAGGDMEVFSFPGMLRIWDVSKAEVTATLRVHRRYSSGVGFSPDGRWLISGGGDDGEILISDPVLGESVAALKAAEAHPIVFGISPSTALLVSAAEYSEPGDLGVWDYRQGVLLRTLPARMKGCTSIAVSSKGVIAAAMRSPFYPVTGSVQVWCASSGEFLTEIKAHKGPVSSLAFSPDGNILATGGSADGAVMLWDMHQLLGNSSCAPRQREREGE